MERLVIAGKGKRGELTAKTADDIIARLLNGDAELTIADIIALEVMCEKKVRNGR